MSTQDTERVRALSRQIFERTKTDPAFKDQIQQDPEASLTAAGLPHAAIGEFLHETKLGDVAGYMASGFCIDTCIFTITI